MKLMIIFIGDEDADENDGGDADSDSDADDDDDDDVNGGGRVQYCLYFYRALFIAKNFIIGLITSNRRPLVLYRSTQNKTKEGQ